jgi:Icc-related predicted phosphoesterase
MKQYEDIMGYFKNYDFMTARATDSFEMLNFLQNNEIERYEKIYIWIGTNDLGYENKWKDIQNNILEIVDICSKKTNKLYIISACYVNNIHFNTPEYLLEKRTSEKIDRLNNFLKTIDNIIYLDLNAKLEENNMLKLDCTNDGLHISTNGYLELISLIESLNE